MQRSGCSCRVLPRWVAWLVVLAATAPASFASDAAGPPGPTFASRTYRAEDGLPSNVIYALAQDLDGYLWAGGSGGLVRFDGMQFAKWGAHGEPPLPYGEVRSLLADREGGLWIGFNEAGVVTRIAQNRVQTYTTHDGLPEGLLSPRAQDRSGTVWAVGRGGIAAFHAGRWEQRQGRDGLPSVAGDDVLEDRSGTLWISTSAGIFRRVTGQAHFELVDRGLASTLGEDLQGRLWLAHPQQGIRRLAAQPSAASDRHPAIPLTGNTMLSDRRGSLWVGSTFHAGLVHVSIDPRTSRLTARPLSDERGVFDKLAVAFLEDSEGNVWVGTTGGLLRFYEPKGRTYSRANGLPDDNVRAIEATSNGALWLGTASGLAKMTSRGVVEPARIRDVTGRAVTSLHDDGQGRLFIGFADSGLGMLANGQFSPIQTPGDAFLENVITVRPDRQGNFWVCNLRDLGVYYWRGQSPFRRMQGTFHPGRGSCSATLLDRSGRIWIGFDDGSLMVQELDGEPRFLRGEGAPRGRVCAMHEDREQVIWLATTAGLSRYSGGKFSTINAQNGLPGDYFTAVIEDENGDLWVCSNSGIFRLTKQQFERAASDAAHRVRYTLYDSADGIGDTPVCYGEPHAARDRDGRLWFTSLSGAVVIDPRRLHEAPAQRSPRIERIVADDVVLTTGNTSLPARTSKVELDYTAVSLSAASKIRFQYRLDGLDTSWVDAGSRRQAFYTNLAPGRYRFQVRTSMNEAAGPATAYEFDVQPAFYQTSVFYAAMMAAATLLLWGVWQLRIRALHQRYALIMDERTRIGREIHDTVLQNMAGVALEIEGVARQPQTSGPGVRDALARISDEIKEHIAEVRHTIFELRTTDEGTANLEDQLREAGERIVGSTPIRFELAVTGTPHECGREVGRELIRIAREALRNAVRHATATCIRVELRYADDALHLMISDNGSGFNVEERLAAESQHWGLLGMTERASRIGAQFNIRSRLGAGTAVEMVVRYAHAM